jgi:hypothetical protein
MTPTKQRKKPVKRAFQGLVGLPPEPEAVMAPLPESIPAKAETTEFVDRVLTCDDCYADFLFSAEDQARCAENQLSPPRRCKSCEAEAIQQVQQAETAAASPISPNIEDIEREKAAKRARERRKRNAGQLAAIKKALRTPVAEIKKAAGEATKAEKERTRLPSMEAGRFVTDAPTGKGELVLGGGSKEMDFMAGARQRGVQLGDATFDSETGDACWPEGDRRRVKPEGTGQRPGDREDDREDDDPGATSDAQDNRTEAGEDADILFGDKFFVKLNDRDNDKVLTELVGFYFIEFSEFSSEYFFCAQCGTKGEADSTELVCRNCGAIHTGEFKFFVCRLCQTVCGSDTASKKHVEDIHGDDRESHHDRRFGNIIYRYLRGGRKTPNIGKAIKKAKADRTA